MNEDGNGDESENKTCQDKLQNVYQSNLKSALANQMRLESIPPTTPFMKARTYPEVWPSTREEAKISPAIPPIMADSLVFIALWK